MTDQHDVCELAGGDEVECLPDPLPCPLERLPPGEGSGAVVLQPTVDGVGEGEAVFQVGATRRLAKLGNGRDLGGGEVLSGFDGFTLAGAVPGRTTG